MARYKKSDLLEIIVQAIQDCNWNVLFVEGIQNHPFLLKIYSNDSEKSYLVRIYVWNLTHGGGTKRPADEYRIQITGIEKFTKQKGEKTLILGWWDSRKVFAGFDYTKHSGTLGFSPSIQIREEALQKANINGLATINKGNEEIAVAFRPDFFIHYIENLEEIHKFGESSADYQILEDLLENPQSVNDTALEKISLPRKLTIATIHKKLRDASFQYRVLTAYDFECAFCGIQLKLIDAAHIVPVSYPNSSDETSNGLALCVLHHRAFDRALVTLNEEYRIIVNNTTLNNLKTSGHGREMARFRKDLRSSIKTPLPLSDRPHIGYIQQANRIRGWE